MARTGRPKLDNPRSEGVFIRLTKQEHTELTEYANNHDLTITQTLVRGFNELQKHEHCVDE